jgi:GNAT superfamily N-acetyltransferase
LSDETLAGTVELHPTGPADEPFLCELDGGVVAEQLGQGGLDPETLATVREMQFIARRRDRAARYPEADEQLIVLDGRPVGAVLIDRSSARILIIDLALIPTARHRGIGTSILAMLVEEAARRGLPLRATTQSTNAPARQLYTRAGFRELDDDGLNVSLERRPELSRGG